MRFVLGMSKPKSTVARLAIACALLAVGPAAQAQQFSADLARRNVDGQVVPAGRLAVSNANVRIEMPEFSDGFFIIRGDATYFISLTRPFFMDAGKSSQLTQILLPVDPDDPCRQWQAMAKVAGEAGGNSQWLCERIGPDLLDGNNTIKYRISSPVNQRYSGWINPRLRFLVRLQAEDGTTVELANLREAPQFGSLFEIPAGYRKLDPQQLIDRIKKSDAWVEPMK
jgi:hypothetical protein